ncbi:MAG: TerC family protein [Dokdonella sp.]
MSFEWIADPQLWIALATLATLEIVLGIDNLVFVSIAVSRLPPERRPFARRLGIGFACITRIALLLVLSTLASMDDSSGVLFEFAGEKISIRDLILILGGLFLLYKSVVEIHAQMEPSVDDSTGGKVFANFGMVIAQIAVIDIVFSLDSVITAIGMVNNQPVMVAAILIAVAIMLLAANPVGDFIDRHPTVRMLALAFLILVGVVLIADGLGFHVPRGYIYFAMGFSIGVEALNIWAKRKLGRTF